MDVLVSTVDGIATLTLNRPEKYNAFDVPFIRQIRETFEAAASRGDVDALVLAGAGKAFCAGGDVSAMRGALETDPKQLFLDLTAQLHPLILAIRETAKPVVGALRGPVAGGGFGFALACDARLGTETTSFKPAYSKLGIVPDGGLTCLLPRIAGFGAAQRIILYDEPVKADEALRLGLVDRLIPDPELLAEAQRQARRLADQPPTSFARTKELLNATLLADLKRQLEEERRRNADSAAGPWLQEGIRAFFEKREPVFRNP